ncbi:MAG: RHS repeat-associated core domain-containing protein, partial [Hymenobacter sp.]
AQGRKTWQAQLDSYGAVREGRGKAQDCPFRYQGQYEDVETGLYYNRFRYYDPEAGSYLSQDPIGLSGGMALYAYVQNPTAWVDVLGLNPCPPTARQQRIAELAEQNAQRRLQELSNNAKTVNPNTHFLERHGAQTTQSQQYTRATTGLTPDGHAGNPVDATRFLSAQDQLRSIERANTIRAQTGANVVNTRMESVIGEGYPRGGGPLTQTDKVRVVYRNGLPYTTFPVIR